jgi:hypothetical protein
MAMHLSIGHLLYWIGSYRQDLKIWNDTAIFQFSLKVEQVPFSDVRMGPLAAGWDLDGGGPGFRVVQVDGHCRRPVGVGVLCVSSPVGKFPCTRNWAGWLPGTFCSSPVRLRMLIKTNKKMLKYQETIKNPLCEKAVVVLTHQDLTFWTKSHRITRQNYAL